MTDKHIAASKLLALPRLNRHLIEDDNGGLISYDDISALINETPEVESVGEYEIVNGKFMAYPDESKFTNVEYKSWELYTSLPPSPDLTKPIGELSDALERAQNGLRWYADEHPKDASEADGELHEEIDALLTRAKEYLK